MRSANAVSNSVGGGAPTQVTNVALADRHGRGRPLPLDSIRTSDYAETHMKTWTLSGALVVSCLLSGARALAAADDATMFRVFLNDGTSLVSYGEMARVGERVVFSMPTASTPNPPLHLVNISADRVDWDHTDRYAMSARATHYIATQAENDYAALSNSIAQALNDVVSTTDDRRRLSIVEQARKTLAEWPPNHYNYRDAEVRQMLGLLDEAIADLRATTGGSRFDLNLVAYAAPATILEPLLPAPTPREAIEQTLAAARIAESAAERMSLLDAALVGLVRDKSVLPEEWVAATAASTRVAIETELQIDRTYQSLTIQMMQLADRRARLADVRGVERLVAGIRERDTALGGTRPDAVNALIAAVEEKLDAARRLRLARDRWALRAPVIWRYYVAISTPMNLFAQLKPALEDIKALAGSSPAALEYMDRLIARIVKQAGGIAPPEELVSSHALFVSAARLAENAARIRREAALSNSLARAWDASSAAAGALMLGEHARTDIQVLLRQPQLP